MHHVHQIGRCQCNRRKGIPTTGLHADTHILAQLDVNGRTLRFAGSNRHSYIRVYLLDKLLGTNVVGQGPQPLTGATGQQNDIHKLLPYRKEPHPGSGCGAVIL